MELRRNRTTGTTSSSSSASDAGDAALTEVESGAGRGFSPISTLVDGAGPASDPTTSEEDEPAEEPRVAATEGEDHPKAKWSRGGGRAVTGDVVGAGADAGGRAGGDRRWDDDDVVTSVPSGASPFGTKTKTTEAYSAR